jgi:hypothetical protein
MAENYVTIGELKETLSLSGENFADGDLNLAITTASRAVDSVCRRRFWADTDATSVRYYTPDDPCGLDVDDLVTLTELATSPGGTTTFSDVWTVNTDFVAEPLNAAADGKPWTRLEPHPTGNYRFPCYPRSVRVTGKFGWAAVPSEVKTATVMLASRLVRRTREAPFGVVSFGMEGAVHIARQDPDIHMLLHDLIRRPIAVA